MVPKNNEPASPKKTLQFLTFLNLEGYHFIFIKQINILEF